MKAYVPIFLFLTASLFLCAACNHDASSNNDEHKNTYIARQKILAKTPRYTVIKIDNVMFSAPVNMKYQVLKPGEKCTIGANLDTLYSDREKIIFGNEKALKTPGVFTKYSRKSDFDNYKNTDVYQGPLANPDFSTDKRAMKFITRIKDECASNGVNFAGHFTIAEWGCGSGCQSMAIVDRINGRIIYSQLPFMNSYSGSEFRKNSRMLVVNTESLSEYWDFEKGYIRVDPISYPTIFVISDSAVIRVE